ncbi:MAG: hemolysin III family protein [Actinobacteria bacterium]|nr:hemolysin III family protein [Actinomycetota bacterium]
METAVATVRRRRPYTFREEIAHSVIHGVGVGLSVAALTLLVVFAARSGSGWKLAGALIYAVALLLEFVASTLYHNFPQPRAKHVFKILDHAGIYLLIAGTYTPFMLVTLRGSGYFWMLALVWSLAAVGIGAEAFWVYRPRWVSAAVYLAMGWLVVPAIGPLTTHLDHAGVWLLVAGGLAYTLGSLFYVLNRVPYMHAVWHLFVLGGSVCHFLVIALFVV